MHISEKRKNVASDALDVRTAEPAVDIVTAAAEMEDAVVIQMLLKSINGNVRKSLAREKHAGLFLRF